MEIKKKITDENLIKKLDVAKNRLLEAITRFEGVISSRDMGNPNINIGFINDLNGKIDVYKARINNILEDEKFEEYNEQYINFVKTYIDNVISSINTITNDFFRSNDSNNIYSIIMRLNMYLSNEDILCIYDQFKDGESNYILFGKNGAGKTSLLKQLNNGLIKDNTIVVPATRNINYKNDIYFHGNDAELVTAIKSIEDGKTIFLLKECIKNKSYLQLKNNVSKDRVLTNIATNIFNDLGFDRFIDIDHEKGINLYNSYNEYYSFSDASDGEKTALYFIFVTLLCPDNSYLFIDEPENHLNGSLMKKLFDVLELSRKDIKFIYATHNTSFIESRNNSKLVYLDKGQKKNEWKCRKIEEDKLPLDILLNIEGTNQNVIFCEGEDTSFDLRVYSILFPNYKITPISGCENVINHTKMVNEYSAEFKKKAFGIIDNDFKNQEKIEELKRDNIFVLSLNEIENIFLIKECIEKAKDKIGSEKSFDEISRVLFETANHQKNVILTDFATKLLRNLHLKNKISNVLNIGDHIDKINMSNKAKFLILYEEFKKNLENVIINNNYYELLKMVPGKILLPKVVEYVGYSDRKLFCNNILNNIDEDLRQIIISKINVSL